jgi:hypothetical protein
MLIANTNLSLGYPRVPQGYEGDRGPAHPGFKAINHKS